MSEASTIGDVLADMFLFGTTRAALVRPIGENVEPAVCVFLTRPSAISDLAPDLIAFARSLGDAPQREIGKITTETALGKLFEFAERADQKWSWFVMPTGAGNIMAFIVVGRAACESLARICCAHGVPCSLDPDNPADGWEFHHQVRRL